MVPHQFDGELLPRPYQRAATMAIMAARAAGCPGFLLGDMTGLGTTLSVRGAIATMLETDGSDHVEVEGRRTPAGWLDSRSG